MNKQFLWPILLAAGATLAADQQRVLIRPATEPARIRLAGIFLKQFSVWRTQAPDCAPPAAEPWLALDCGFIKCPKPQLLGIPLELDYSNWRKSPRMTEVEIAAEQPFAVHLGGTLVTGSLGAGFAAAAGLTYTVNHRSCVFDLRFTPRAGGQYEATIDPAEGGGCFLRLTEIRATETGLHERVAIAGAETRACGG